MYPKLLANYIYNVYDEKALLFHLFITYNALLDNTQVTRSLRGTEILTLKYKKMA